MKYRNFGSTNLTVSEVGFGAWAIGGPAMAGNVPIGWGNVNDKTSTRAMEEAFNLGVNFYDTADFYGLGHSEKLIGNLWGNSDDIIVATKVGHRLDDDNNIYVDYTKDYIIEACEASLKRLKRDTIDYYQLHTAKVEHLEKGGCIEAMQLLQNQGKIRYWGLSLDTFNPWPEAEFMLDNGYGDGFQLVFNIINQRAIPIISDASAKGMGVIARMPLQFGLLTGKFNKDSTFPITDHRSFRLTPAILRQSLDDLDPVWSIAEKYSTSLASFALSFILSHPEVSTAIPGIKTPDQAISNTTSIVSLSEEDLSSLHDLFEERFDNLLKLMK